MPTGVYFYHTPEVYPSVSPKEYNIIRDSSFIAAWLINKSLQLAIQYPIFCCLGFFKL